MKKLRPRLTFANVVSCLALFVALGGSAYAATQLKKNSVGTKQLKNNAVTSAKIKNGAIVAGKVKANSLTGAQIKASSLGTVPTADFATNAGTLNGVGPSGLLSADHLVVGHASLNDPGAQTIFTDPRTGLEVAIGTGGAVLKLTNTNAKDLIEVDGIGFPPSQGKASPAVRSLKAGETKELGFEAAGFQFGTFQAMRITSGDPTLSFNCMRAEEDELACAGVG